MEIVVNGEPMTVEATTLAELLARLGYGDGKVATAVDGEFVAARERSDRSIEPGCRVEIVAPRQGG